jgi:hypothetical protein
MISKDIFRVNFNHIIEPNIEIKLNENNTADIKGKIYIEIDNMISNLIDSLSIKSIFDKIISKEVTSNFYLLNIRGIAKASISVKDNKLFVKAEYLPGKEWWVKPVALLVLSTILYDFAIKVEKSGIEPGFRNEIKKSLQSLRKTNSSQIDLRNLFINQKYKHFYKKITLKDYLFKKVFTYNDKNLFVIDFEGISNIIIEN